MTLVAYDGLTCVWWVAHELDRARAAGWTGRLISGYRTALEQDRAARAFADQLGVSVASLYPRGVQASNHRGVRWPSGAGDVTRADQLATILRTAPHQPRRRRLVWAIDAGLDDWVHFSRTGR